MQFLFIAPINSENISAELSKMLIVAKGLSMSELIVILSVI
jgi:hypothetical protein